ncbi:MAG TPA: hypothetical protein VIE65_06730 [Methylobacter sp.]|jgi:hypothetical protein
MYLFVQLPDAKRNINVTTMWQFGYSFEIFHCLELAPSALVRAAMQCVSAMHADIEKTKNGPEKRREEKRREEKNKAESRAGDVSRVFSVSNNHATRCALARQLVTERCGFRIPPRALP